MGKVWWVAGVLLCGGCASWTARQPVQYLQANPTLVPISDPEYVWEKVVDTVNDYFRIEREEPVRLVGEVVTEGFLETKPEAGGTLLEPWRRDVVNRYERLEGTLQSIRRRAIVKVVPDERGYMVEITVFKELEDLARAQQVSAGDNTFRNDQSRQPFREPITDDLQPAGWIPLGRDYALEQVMIRQLQGSLGHGP